MTRINVAIKPDELSKQHLISELREIKRIPNMVLKGKFNLNDIPNEFKLEKGHVKFFYNKLYYLYERYSKLYNHALELKINVSDYSESFIKAIEKYPHLANNYTETTKDRTILLERLKERDFKFYKNLK